MIGEVVSKYRLIAEIGRGAMGTVYKAQDVYLGRFAAVKLIGDDQRCDTETLARFEREGQAASALMHPNICTVFETGHWKNRPFLVMELLEGVSLSDRMKSGRIEAREAIRITASVMSALEAAHRVGIVHRDIKPANVFLTSRGGVKVLDFGLAKRKPDLGKLMGEDAPTMQTFVTMPGTILGTLAYMSPEQVRGENVDGRADLYSMGVVLYEMCSGNLPAFGSTSLKVSPDVIAVLRKLMSPKREDRFQTASEALKALESLPVNGA